MRFLDFLFEFEGEREKRWNAEQRAANFQRGERRNRWDREYAEQKKAQQEKRRIKTRKTMNAILDFAQRNKALIPAMLDILSGTKNSAMHFEGQTFSNFLSEFQAAVDPRMARMQQMNLRAKEEQAEREKVQKRRRPQQKQLNMQQLQKLDQVRDLIKSIPRGAKRKLVSELKNIMNPAPQEKSRIIMPR